MENPHARSPATAPRPIAEIAARLGLRPRIGRALRPGQGQDRSSPAGAAGEPTGKLILVTAMTPTPAGEGKTTTVIGLADALNRLGTKAAVALREPSLGPVFGMKGGATGGGKARVVPSDDINLHFTGDMHAVTSAHNLLAAMVDNHLHFDSACGLDRHAKRHAGGASSTWTTGRCGRSSPAWATPSAASPARPASTSRPPPKSWPSSACRATSRISRSGSAGSWSATAPSGSAGHGRPRSRPRGPWPPCSGTPSGPTWSRPWKASPAFIHGGPFANIAHGTNSVIATGLALGLADVVVTECGFASDLGAEKFFDIVVRTGHVPAAVGRASSWPRSGRSSTTAG